MSGREARPGQSVCEPEAERERDKLSNEIAGGRHGSKLLLFGTNVLYFQHKLNYIDVDDSVSFEKISIHFKYRYIAQPYRRGFAGLNCNGTFRSTRSTVIQCSRLHYVCKLVYGYIQKYTLSSYTI